MYKEILKKYDVLDFLQRLYLFEEEEHVHEINLDYLLDFKMVLEREFSQPVDIEERLQ